MTRRYRLKMDIYVGYMKLQIFLFRGHQFRQMASKFNWLHKSGLLSCIYCELRSSLPSLLTLTPNSDVLLLQHFAEGHGFELYHSLKTCLTRQVDIRWLGKLI